MKVKKFVGLLLVGTMFLSGCAEFLGQAAAEIVKFNQATDCSVESVDGMLGDHSYVCKNSLGTYIFHSDAVYQHEADGSESKLFDAHNLKCMACNEDAIYFESYDEEWALRRYDFATKKVEAVLTDYGIIGMRAEGEAVFVVTVDSGADESRRQNLFYYDDKDEGVNLNDRIEETEPAYTTGDFAVYEYGEYRLVAKAMENSAPEIVLIENEDGFQYSCAEENTYANVDGEYIELVSGETLTYQYCGEEKELSEVMEATDLQNYWGGFWPSLIAVQENQIYILEQYSQAVYGVGENPSLIHKDLDGFFRFTPEMGKCELLYRCEEGEQLAGFSVEENCVYLMEYGATYRYDLDTKEKEEIISYGEYYAIRFEYLDGELYVWGYNFDENTLEFVGIAQ